MKRFIAGLLALALACAPAFAADKNPLANYGGGAIPLKSGDAVGAAYGGTGLNSLTAHCVMVGAGTSAAHLVCPGTSGLPLTSAGSTSDPAFGALGCNALPALTGDVTTSAGACATTIGANKVTLGDIAQIGANTVLGNATGSTANAAAQSMPSCSGTTNALTWTTSSGFGCNTIAGGAAGAMVNAGSQTVSGASSVVFTVSAGYDYRIVADSVTMGTNNVSILIQCAFGATPTWDTGNNYFWVTFGSQSGSGGPTSSMSLASSVNNARLDALVVETSGATSGTIVLFTGSFTEALHTMNALYTTPSGPITAIRIIPSSGTISGHFILYSIAR